MPPVTVQLLDNFEGFPMISTLLAQIRNCLCVPGRWDSANDGATMSNKAFATKLFKLSRISLSNDVLCYIKPQPVYMKYIVVLPHNLFQFIPWHNVVVVRLFVIQTLATLSPFHPEIQWQLLAKSPLGRLTLSFALEKFSTFHHFGLHMRTCELTFVSFSSSLFYRNLSLMDISCLTCFKAATS